MLHLLAYIYNMVCHQIGYGVYLEGDKPLLIHEEKLNSVLMHAMLGLRMTENVVYHKSSSLMMIRFRCQNQMTHPSLNASESSRYLSVSVPVSLGPAELGLNKTFQCAIVK